MEGYLYEANNRHNTIGRTCIALVMGLHRRNDVIILLIFFTECYNVILLISKHYTHHFVNSWK